jgi:dihydroorotate dehydrogenase
MFGKKILNPVGLAAGFDKNGEAIDGMLEMGFGFVEIGSITPLPQPGNEKPRIFRLEDDEAVINRYGFNSDGKELVLERLKRRVQRHNTLHPNKSLKEKKLLGINLGKNKTSPMDSNDDYIDGIKTFASHADYLVVNISSPNTPGLRTLQKREYLDNLIKEMKDTLKQSSSPNTPLVFKISPDLSDDELLDIAHIALKYNVDGVIVSNTTISRNLLKSKDMSLINQTGGLSGKPLFTKALKTVNSFYKMTEGNVFIIGCGGISSGSDALKFIEAGASAVQIYTALVYQGPSVVGEIKDYLSNECLKRNVDNVLHLREKL